MNAQKSSAKAAVEAVIGRRYGPYLSWHPVSEPLIWQWVEAFGDRNPLYSDADFARSNGYESILSPAAMVQSWCLPSMSRTYPPDSSKERPYDVLDIASRHGFNGQVAVAYDQRFLRPVQLGDALHYWVEPVHVSDEKSTRLGTGHFITCLEEYINQNGEVVSDARTTYFKFRGEDHESPAADPETRDAGVLLRPPEEYETEIEWRHRGESFEPGAEIGEMHVPVTSSRIVVCAMASRDWMPVHHSRESAQGQAQPDIFMNILTTAGLAGRFLTDWAGPGSTVKHVKLSLGVPNYPGDHMVITGRVESVREEGGSKIVDVSYQGQNGLGPHVTGSAAIACSRVQPPSAVGGSREARHLTG